MVSINIEDLTDEQLPEELDRVRRLLSVIEFGTSIYVRLIYRQYDITKAMEARNINQ